MSGKNEQVFDENQIKQRVENLTVNHEDFMTKPEELAEKTLAKQSVEQALLDNQMIEAALKNAETYNIDASKKAMLQSIKGRNLSHILLNNRRYRSDSDEMTAVKDALKDLADELEKPLEFNQIEVDVDNPELLGNERKNALRPAWENTKKMFAIEERYTEAIRACTKYLKAKTPESEKGIERYKLVRDNRQNLLNELNHLKNAKQLVWRGYIGRKPVTPRELILEEKDYVSKNKFVTANQKKIYDNFDHNLRSVYSFSSRYENDEKKLTKEGHFLLDVFDRGALPDALVDNFGTKKEDKERAAKMMNTFWKALTRFEENRLQTVTLHVGEDTFSLFQREDNTLDLIFFRMDKDASGEIIEQSVIKNLGVSARKLAAVFGKNMIEHEDIFGKAQTSKILEYTKDIREDSGLNESSDAADIGVSVLVKRLGLTNIDFSNIPAGEILEKAKQLDSKKLTEEQVKQWVKDYEYGDKEQKRKERDKKLKEKKDLKENIDGFLVLDNEKTIDETLKEEEEKEKLQELNEELNEELMEKGGKEIIDDEVNKAREEEIKKRDAKAVDKEMGYGPAKLEDLQKSLEIRNDWEKQINDVASAYKAEVDKVREEQKKSAEPITKEINKLKEEQQKAIQAANETKLSLLSEVEKAGEQIKGKLDELSKEYDKKLKEHDKKKKSKETQDQKLVEAAKFTAASAEIFDEFQAEMDRIDALLISENKEEKITEKEADDLKEAAAKKYITQKNDLTEKYEKVNADFDKEPEELKGMREEIDRLSAELTKSEESRASIENSTDEELKKIDEKIKEQELLLTTVNISFDTKISEIESQGLVKENTLKTGMENELSLFDDWIEYRRRTQNAENSLDYEAWKTDRKETYEKREAERKLAEEKDKKKKEKITSYRNLVLDIKELEEKDLSSTTSEKVNGLDTLNLLKHREKIVKQGKLDKLIIRTEKVEKKANEELDKKVALQADQAKKQFENVNSQLKECERLKEAEENKTFSLLDEQTYAIGKIENEQKYLSDKIGMLSLEYEEKYKQYTEYLQSPGVQREKAQETAKYLSALEELENSYLNEQNKLDAEHIYDEEQRQPGEMERDLLGLLEGDFINKRAEIENEFARKSEKWAQESLELRTLREYIEKLTADVADLETTRKQHVAEYEKIDRLYKEDVLSRNEIIKQLENEQLELRKTIEANRRLKEEKEAEKKKEQKKQEEKEKAIQEGREWSEDELALKDFIADFIYSSKTWDMDNETVPGERIWNLIKKNQSIIGKLAGNKQKANKMLMDMVSKLPTDLIGISKEDIAENVGKVVGFLNDMALQEVNKRAKEIEERDKAREEFKKNEEKRRLEWEKRQADRRKEWELKKTERDAKQEEEFNKFLEEHKELSELSAEEKRAKYKSHKEGKKTVDNISNMFSGIASFFFGAAKEENKEEKKDEKDFTLEEEFKEEEFVENKYDDPSYYEDLAFKKMNDEARIRVGIGIATNVDFKELGDMQEKIDELIKTEKEIEEKVHLQLREVQKKLSKAIKKQLGGSKKEEKINMVDYYREKGISLEERANRIAAGNDELEKMLQNAMSGKEGQGQYLRNILSSYLSESSVLDLRSMLSSAIRNAKPAKLSDNSSEEQKNKAISSWLGGLFKGAGPLLQKTLQGVPENMIPKGLEEAFSDMKDNLASIPDEIVEAQLLAMIERSEGAIESIEIKKSLGAASVGQAFLCTVHTRDNKEKEVVIKLLRPDVRNRMLREEKILRKCAADAGDGMLRTFEGQMERIREELDLTIEARNCERGAIYDLEGSNVSAMKVSRIVEPTVNSLMVERASGDTVTSVLRKAKKQKEDCLKEYYVYDKDGNLEMDGAHPKLKITVGDAHIQSARTELSNRLNTLQRQQKMLVDLAEKWVSEAVFGNGFYHGDLHSGNIMMDSRSLTVIDFGNATQLTEYQREKVTQLLLAAAAGSGTDFLEGFEGLISEASKELLATKREELLEVFREVMHMGDARSAAMRIGAALVRAQKLGFELPGSIYGFQQCQMRIQNTIDEFNKEIKDLQYAMAKLKAADGESKFDIGKKYAKESARRVRNATMFTLIPAESEDFRTLLKDTSKKGRDAVESLFDSKLLGIHDMLGFSFTDLQNAMTSEDSIKMFIKQNNLEYVFEGSTLFNDMKEFVDAQSDEAKKAAYDKFNRKYRMYDIEGALKELHKAQDNGEPADVLKRHEDYIISAIGKVKESFFNVKRRGDAKEKEELKALQQADPKQKFDEKEYNAENCYGDDFETLMKPIKENLKNEKLKAQAEAEFKVYFEDEKFGAKLKTAFDAYYDALEKNQDDVTKERLLNEFIEALRMPTITRLYEAERLKKDEADVDTEIPDDFLTVMQYVIGAKWQTALKYLSLKKAIRSAWVIKEDLDGRRLSFWDVVKIVKG